MRSCPKNLAKIKILKKNVLARPAVIVTSELKCVYRGIRNNDANIGENATKHKAS